MLNSASYTLTQKSLSTPAWSCPLSRCLLLTIVFALLTAVGAMIRVPLPGTPVPLTLQTLFVISSGCVLGSQWGAASQLLYILLGVIGLPVFADSQGGWVHLFGPTAGYLCGFVLASFVVGWIQARMRQFPTIVGAALAALAGTVVIFGMGVGWLSFQLGSWEIGLQMGLYPFMTGAILKWGLITMGVTTLCNKQL